MMTSMRAFLFGGLVAGLSACASQQEVVSLAPPTPFDGTPAAIEGVDGRPMRVHLLFAELYPNGRPVGGQAFPASRLRYEAGWMWDVASMTIDALERSGIEVVEDPQQADAQIVYELASKTPNHLRPIGFAAPDSATAWRNTATNLVSFGLVSNEMVGYVNADYRARIRTPSGEKVHSVPITGATDPFRQNDFNLDWRKEAFALTRDMYLPKLNTAIGQLVVDLEPTLETAIN